ncbi:glycosyltransferase involved in cell wall biosynthesis [Actinoplanes octamycinicus]|uniref:Glycosyltransferase involved in cell wall biosynthesis n=1 Tax=Actinoplanes octamycinicus TaxID=135948 RepID=A0A7W7M4I6_9ACTN|nr:glycosyltransferase family 4 protein [Actinoplanes octamycinicus]MBB4736653.1 glycosyltransferase involved in cell wall biosynthesis [Actinoplanes octamycinicus]GIE63141.1 glycosyl transferase [Actinoplanes octamycinicus]
MKILHLSNLYAPVIGGLERSIATSSEELVRRGHEVTVLTLATPAAPGHETINGVRVHRVRSVANTLLPAMNENPDKPFHPTCPDPLATAAIARLLRAEHFDVVHSHDWLMYSYLPLRRSRLGRPHVHTAHDFGLTCVRKTFARDGGQCPGPRLSRCVSCASAQYGRPRSAALTAGLHAQRHRGIDALTAISSSVARALDLARLPGDLPVQVVSSLVPDGLDELARNTPRPDWLPTGDYLLFVGALGPHKGIHVLFDAYRELVAGWAGPRPAPALVCLGTRRDDTPPPPPGVLIRHDVPHAEVMAAWRGAAAGAVPSLNEGMGQVAVEAMLAGAPLVASAAGGLTDVVRDGESGLLVPPGDVAALHAALLRVLTDQELAARLRAAGQRRGLEFTAARVVPRIEEVYRACIAAS